MVRRHILVFTGIVLCGLVFSAEVSGQQEWHRANKLILGLHPNGSIGGATGIFESWPGLLYPCLDPPWCANSNLNPWYHDYLHNGGIWLGGVVNAESIVIASSSRCSYGNNGSGFWLKEFITVHPFPDAELFYAEYADSTTGVEVQQKSYAFYYPESYKEFIIFDLKIANLGSYTFEDLYLGVEFNGIAYSCPVYDCNREMSGVRILPNGPSGDTAYIGWVADNDGNPVGGYFNEDSPTSVVGVKILYPRAGDCQTSFNWYSFGDYLLDVYPKWGPTLQSNFNKFGYMTDSSLGWATTCREKYYLMSNGEIDYDQYLSHLDHTAEGWLPPADSALKFAQGSNSAFLLSCGPVVNLYPNDTLRFSYAVLGGMDFHKYPGAYDSTSPFWVFYDFSTLLTNALTAQQLYDSLFNPSADVGEEPLALPKQFRLLQNYPNPFNATTTIRYHLSKSSNVTLEIFNLKGQLVRVLLNNTTQPAGEHQRVWDGKNSAGVKVSSGVYLYRFKTGEFSQVRKMILLK